MRALILTNLFPFPSDRTRGIFNFQQFSKLPDDIEALVLVPVPWMLWRKSFARIFEFEGLKVKYFRFLYPPRMAQASHHRWMWYSLRLSGIGVVDDFGAECVLGCFLYPDGSVAARLSERYRVPLVLKAHGSDVNSKAMVPALRLHIDTSVSKAYCVIAVCDALADRIRQIGLPVRALRTIENGIDLHRFTIRDKTLTRVKLGIEPGRRIILYVGNLKAEKGCLDLMEATESVFARAPEAVLVVVGEGECMPRMRAWSEGNSIRGRVLLLGRKTHDEVALYLSAADLLVLPSHAEGLPNVVLEAFASGRPVVGTAVGAIPSLLAKGGGELVPVNSPAQLAAGILGVLGSHYDALSLRSMTAARSWGGSAESLALVLRQAAASRAS